MKKILGILFTIVLIVSVCVPASAANSTDSDFIIPINRSDFPINTSYMRKKTDSSSAYINYSTRTNGSPASGVNRFEAIIYGADDGRSNQFTDCTSVIWGTNIERPKAIVTKGTRGFVRQDVYERFGINAWAELTGIKAYAYDTSGSAAGCWSPDSVWEDLSHYN